MDQLVLFDLNEQVATVTINNPKARNALSRKLLVELAGRIEGLMSDKDCRAIILTGAEGTFSSGGRPPDPRQPDLDEDGASAGAGDRQF